MNLLKNRYKFEKILGQGGMGKVYLCLDIQTNQLVAVKQCIPPKENTSESVERIRREYYFLTKIRHPNLVYGIDFFESQNHYFIVMEYVEGITLQQLILERKNTINFEKQLEIAKQICGAISVLNENGVIHRDLKPANIMLKGKKLVPKILDLGIAKSINRELVTITNSEMIIGTPEYMAPEQMEDELEIGKNTDVFALGVIFHQFFSWSESSPFYAGHSISTMDKIVHFSPPILDLTGKWDYISQIINRALEKDPSKRITSVTKMLRAMENSSKSTKKRSTAVPKKFHKNNKNAIKKLRIIILGFTFLVVLILLLIRASRANEQHNQNQVFTIKETKQQINLLFKQGQQYSKQNKFELAIEKFSSIIKKDPKYINAYMLRAIAYDALQKNDLALNDYEKVIELNPQFPKVYNNRGNIYHHLGKYREALADYNKAIELNPQYSRAYANRGILYSYLKKHSKVFTNLDKAIKFAPQNPKLYNTRAKLYQNVRKYKEALMDVNKALELNPKNADFYSTRGVVYADMRNISKSLENYNKAIELNPYNSSYYFNRGGIFYYDLRKYSQALKDYNKAIELKSNNFDYYYNRGNLLYSNLQKPQEALADFNKVIELSPANANAYSARGIVYYNLKKHNFALADYNKAIDLDPKDPNFFYNRGVFYKDFKKYQEALVDMNKVIDLDPKYLRGYLTRGTIYAKQKKYDKAISNYNKILIIAPNTPEAHQGLFITYKNTGKNKKAEYHLQKYRDLKKP
ncbi:tetratricopeptide repeat protein [Candidatus Uabimicrobium sp. HlEnr_7]|uniref:serine/threonine-protein kinase n=1 Tax=Candidatus Uabimicrobium helgolandensis TaxID=3095367 RepID=UPI0035581B38